MLVIIWVAATIGIAVRMAWLDAPYPLVAVVYLVVGWLMVIDLPAYLAACPTARRRWSCIGGLLYTVGGVVYAVAPAESLADDLRVPRGVPRPRRRRRGEPLRGGLRDAVPELFRWA